MTLDAAAVTGWFREHARDLPWRRPGFSAWGTLISELMLQQTQVARVVPVVEEWLRRWPTPADLAAASQADVLRAWGRLGYPRRALALHACAAAIAERHGNRVPEDVDELLALPGVGDYTARAVAVFAHGGRHPVVDTNVRRVLARAVDGVAQPAAPSARRDLPAMSALLPEDLEEQRLFNAGMMEIGAVLCTARAPRCDECPLRRSCAWRAAGSPAHDGPPVRRQPRFEGSDRQRRGRVMAELRASDVPLTEAELARAVPEAARILEGLERDGLAARAEGGWALPA
ncbi:A/G-specific adenine glycosylase [Amnibacterium endophyticum]|uniref:Adenine DNA glycosylase n=1 Tax=Amnibacterium endophyticum TaxID=2109337 RepID=A0ABW4LIY3_9MICO